MFYYYFGVPQYGMIPTRFSLVSNENHKFLFIFILCKLQLLAMLVFLYYKHCFLFYFTICILTNHMLNFMMHAQNLLYFRNNAVLHSLVIQRHDYGLNVITCNMVTLS